MDTVKHHTSNVRYEDWQNYVKVDKPFWTKATIVNNVRRSQKLWNRKRRQCFAHAVYPEISARWMILSPTVVERSRPRLARNVKIFYVNVQQTDTASLTSCLDVVCLEETRLKVQRRQVGLKKQILSTQLNCPTFILQIDRISALITLKLYHSRV